MNKSVKSILFTIITVLSLFSSNLFAGSEKMIFWYPGEAGKSSDAAPLLEEFFSYLGMHIEGTYFNKTKEGLDFINNEKPKFGIVSWIALQENKDKMPEYNIIADTLPLPDGTPVEQFVIVGRKHSGEWVPAEKLKILSSLPINFSFFKQYMFPSIKDSSEIEQTDKMFFELKIIAAEGNKVALLTPMEAFSLKSISSEWAKNLSVLAHCQNVPSAKLIYFGSKTDQADILLSKLLKMPLEKNGQEILESLRLKGFRSAQ